jgi:hypothetical protein
VVSECNRPPLVALPPSWSPSFSACGRSTYTAHDHEFNHETSRGCTGPQPFGKKVLGEGCHRRMAATWLPPPMSTSSPARSRSRSREREAGSYGVDERDSRRYRRSRSPRSANARERAVSRSRSPPLHARPVCIPVTQAEDNTLMHSTQIPDPYIPQPILIDPQIWGRSNVQMTPEIHSAAINEDGTRPNFIIIPPRSTSPPTQSWSPGYSRTTSTGGTAAPIPIIQPPRRRTPTYRSTTNPRVTVLSPDPSHSYDSGHRGLESSARHRDNPYIYIPNGPSGSSPSVVIPGPPSDYDPVIIRQDVRVSYQPMMLNTNA